jgi:hypothetical protein
MARRWWFVLLLASVAACSSTTGTGQGATPGTGEAAAGTTVAVPAARAPALAQYFLRDGKVAAGQAQPVPGVDAQSPEQAVRTLIKGLTDADKVAGLTTAIPLSVQLHSLTVADGTATADFSRDLEQRDTEPAVGQIVYTLTAFADITHVKLLIDGLPNGAAGVLPYTRADVPRVTPDVLIESPTPGESFGTGSIKVSGDVATSVPSFGYRFEANGQPVADGTITTKFGSGPRKKFDQVVDLPAGTSGALTMVVSPPTGSTPAQLTIPIAVG